MAWRREGDKPLSKPMMTQFIVAWRKALDDRMVEFNILICVKEYSFRFYIVKKHRAARHSQYQVM